MIILISNRMTKEKYQCLICFENIKYPPILDLNCECQYNVHFKCYNKWWKMKRTCIICQTPAGRARPYYKFKDKSNYHFLLDLHHKSNKSNKSNKMLTIQNIIPNLNHHIVFVISGLIIDIIFFDVHIIFILVFLVLYFLLIIP